MLRWAFLISVISLGAFALLATSTPLPPPQQPIQFSHKLHLDHFADEGPHGHRQSMVSMHRQRLLKELEDEEIVDEMMEMVVGGNCTLCHGDFDENVEDVAKLGRCAECHRYFLDHDWEEPERKAIRPCMGCHHAAVPFGPLSIPHTNTCAACHPLPLPGEDDEPKPEEKQLLMYIQQENEQDRVIPWQRVYDYMPSEIVFSHEWHVELGRVKCQECHGAVREAEGPLSFEVNLSMEDCMDCHKVTGADNDCLACHR